MLTARPMRAVLVAGAVVTLALLAASPASASLLQPGMPAASLDSVQASGTSIALRWIDRSTSEIQFQVHRRNAAGGGSTMVTAVPTRNKTGTGDVYTFTDTIAAGTRQCYEIINHDNFNGWISFSTEVCTSALPALPALPPPVEGDGIGSLVDMSVLAGIRNSSAVGVDGKGIISYRAGGWDGDLRVAHCKDVKCTEVDTHDIDTLGDVGDGSSIKIGSDGLPIISYLKTSTFDLKVAHCVDVVCSSATITTLDTASQVDNETALTIGSDGRATIAYVDNLNGRPAKELKVAHCQNAACTTATINVVDNIAQSFGFSGGFSLVSIASSPTGRTYLAYLDHHYLNVATCADVACADAQFYTVVLPTDGQAGFDPSIAIGRDGLPLISYQRKFNVGNTSLFVAHCVNVQCSAVATKAVSTAKSTGKFSSIAIGADGLGVVSFFNSSDGDLVAAHCSNVACDAVSQTTLLDEYGDVGWNSSMSIGSDGLPLISYYDLTNRNLKVAHCEDAACARPLIAPFFE